MDYMDNAAFRESAPSPLSIYLPSNLYASQNVHLRLRHRPPRLSYTGDLFLKFALEDERFYDLATASHALSVFEDTDRSGAPSGN